MSAADRPSQRVLLVAPLVGTALAIAHAVTLHWGWLSSGSAGTDAALLLFSLAIAAGNLGLSSWQHRTIVRPLRDLARSPAGAADTCRDAAREIALLGRRLAPAVAPPERDGLTGLLSAAGMHATAPSLLDRALAERAQQLLLVIDIARLRDINGLHGFSFGDDLLRQFARRLTAVTGVPPTAARMGGDRFALLVPNAAGAESAGATAVAVTDALARPFLIAGCEVSLRAHTGAALFPDHASSFDRLMRAAELALESTRRGDGRWRLFDPQLNRAAVARKTMEKELKRAIEHGELLLHYQPQVDLAAGRVVAVEALLRWQHPERGIVAAADLHPDRRGQRPDPADRRLGAGGGVPRHETLARAGHSDRHLGQRLRRPAQAPGPAGDREPGARTPPACPPPRSSWS